MDYQRLALAFLSIGTVSAGMGAAEAATVTHFYGLSNTLTDAYGGPTLVSNGGSLSASGYSFAANQGLSLSNAIDPNNYSILLDYSLSDTAGWNKVIDFKNLTSDNGLYHQNGKLNFYPKGASNTTSIGDNTPVRLVITRDGATTAGYFNGVQEFSFNDTSNDGVFSASNNIINFFIDDAATSGSEASGGSLQQIVIYNGALSSGEVSNLGTVGAPIAGAEVPEPFTIVGTLIGGTAALRMRKKLTATDKV
jgi:hypothetical protein